MTMTIAGTKDDRLNRRIMCIAAASAVVGLVLFHLLYHHHRRCRIRRHLQHQWRQQYLLIQAAMRSPAHISAVRPTKKRVRFGWERVRRHNSNNHFGHSRQDLVTPITRDDAAWNLNDPAYHKRFRSARK